MPKKWVHGRRKNNMKSSPYVIIVPLVIALLIVGSVLVLKYMSPVSQETKAALVSPTPAGFPVLHVPTGKPSAGFEAIQPVSPVSDLRQSLQTTEDEGLPEFDSLTSDASKL